MDDKLFYIDFNHGRYEIKNRITGECVMTSTNYVEAIEFMKQLNESKNN